MPVSRLCPQSLEVHSILAVQDFPSQWLRFYPHLTDEHQTARVFPPLTVFRSVVAADTERRLHTLLGPICSCLVI